MPIPMPIHRITPILSALVNDKMDNAVKIASDFGVINPSPKHDIIPQCYSVFFADEICYCLSDKKDFTRYDNPVTRNRCRAHETKRNRKVASNKHHNRNSGYIRPDHTRSHSKKIAAKAFRNARNLKTVMGMCESEMPYVSERIKK